MTPHSRIRRIGWIAALATCTALYLGLHLKVHSVRSEVIAAERQIVALEQRKLLLETEFETRANQLQLAAWNTIDFGYTAPTARQFLENERQLVSFGSPRAPGAPEPIRVAGAGGAEEPAFPALVSPSTGRSIDPELIDAADGARFAAARDSAGTMRIPLGAVMGVEAR
jgi:hypothetical protein